MNGVDTRSIAIDGAEARRPKFSQPAGDLTRGLGRYSEVLSAIMHRHGVTVSLPEFHQTVNVVFHQYEAEVYDHVHSKMWKSLPEQFRLLAEDALRVLDRNDFSLLDVGCGTGLAAKLMLETPLGQRVGQLDLLDTSSEMLRRARKRLGDRPSVSTICGELCAVAGPYDVILACSVLHHIPDLRLFFEQIEERLTPGGVFIHLQDPNGDQLQDPQLVRRLALSQNAVKTSGFIARAVARVTRRFGSQDYIEKINRELLRRGVIQSPLSDDEYWKFTDIHHENGLGISISSLANSVGLKLISTRSYMFFGKLVSELTPVFREQERAMSRSRQMDGWALAAVWQKAD